MRFIPHFIFACAVALAGCNPASGGPPDLAYPKDLDGNPPVDLALAPDLTVPPPTGAELYGRYCALCHGNNGEGYAADNANALRNQAFLATATDSFLRAAIARGRPGTAMSAWGKEKGGPLDDAEVDRLVAFIRGWQTAPNLDVHGSKVTGEPMRGALQFQFRCAVCHGEKGEGKTALSLNNPEFLATASDGYIRHAIDQGRPLTDMQGYGNMLTAQAIDDLVALIRSWQKPVDMNPVDQPVFDSNKLVINANGPEPAFGMPGAMGKDRFIPVDTVKGELDKGAAMVILDARAGSDYVRDHIAGATSVPFFDVAKYVDRLPKGNWIVTYCACPHAASVAAADALERAGFTRVRVLDEGYNVWKERGYPTRPGVNP